MEPLILGSQPFISQGKLQSDMKHLEWRLKLENPPCVFLQGHRNGRSTPLKLCKMVGLLFQLLEAVLLYVPSTTGASLIPFTYSKHRPDWIVCFLMSIFPDSAALLLELSVCGKILFCPPGPNPKRSSSGTTFSTKPSLIPQLESSSSSSKLQITLSTSPMIFTAFYLLLCSYTCLSFPTRL